MDEILSKNERSAIKKIVLFGPESTGKTMLTEKLAKHYQTLFAPEFARHYLDLKRAIPTKEGSSSNEICEPEDIAPIVLGQLAFEDALVGQTNQQLLFCDTNPLMTYGYSYYYYKTKEEWIAKVVEDRKYDLYLLLDIDIPWVPDPPHRDRPNDREALFSLFKEVLEERNLPYVKISGNYEERFALCVSVVDEFLK